MNNQIELTVEELDNEDPEKQLEVWLDELDTLAMGLDKVSSTNSRPNSSELIQQQRMDSFRFSMVNMEDTQDVDLDAILGELNALDTQFDEALQSTKDPNDVDINSKINGNATIHNVNSMNGTEDYNHIMAVDGRRMISRNKREIPALNGTSTITIDTTTGNRTHSPDNDSAYSDSASLLSSESSTTSSSGRGSEIHPSHRPKVTFQTDITREEKIKLAIQKMREASVQKLFIKVFNEDGSTKSLLVDEGMSCGYVTRLLVEKNHLALEPSCALVEQLTDLHMERIYEDHEPIVEQLMQWTRDSKNKLVFCRKRMERTLLFDKPQLFIGPTDNLQANSPQLDHYTSSKMLEDFFSGTAVPSVEGPLYIKTDGNRKGWKKYHCMLRASGLYYWPKDKGKSSSRDLVCLAMFENNQIYYGIGWKKKYKSPTEYCFAIKHPCVQQLTSKSNKFIKYLCAEDHLTMLRWITAFRIIKYGRQLLVNYKALLEECCLLNGVNQVDVEIPSRPDSMLTLDEDVETDDDDRTAIVLNNNNNNDIDIGDDCSTDSSVFCQDFANGQGTIKRKPPKLPLTQTTRQLKDIATGKIVAESLGEYDEGDADDEADLLPPPPPEMLAESENEDNFDCAMLPPPPPPPPIVKQQKPINNLPALPAKVPLRQPQQLQQNQAFLQHLAKLMNSKWQLAEKCKTDTSMTPHEVLGFRDPPLSDYKESNVRDWVAEHYGLIPPIIPSNNVPLYENVYNNKTSPQQPPRLKPILKTSIRKPPPPPPPRAVTTQLTTVKTENVVI